MNLTCVVKESPEPPQYIFWYRDEQVSRENMSVSNVWLSVDKSFLGVQYANVGEIQMNECGTLGLGRISKKEMKEDISL